MRRPSDLGFPDDGFTLPPLEYRQHVVEPGSPPDDGTLFDVAATGLREERDELRRSLDERCEKAGELLADASPGIAWCHLNAEGDLLEKLIPGAVQVAGADPLEAKEEKLAAFAAGEIRVLVSKPVDRRVGPELAALPPDGLLPVAFLRSPLPGRTPLLAVRPAASCDRRHHRPRPAVPAPWRT